MPRRTDLEKILLIGAGPFVIGQACEFVDSGTQGAKSLGEEGYEVVLVNSNPATIMTDPDLAYATYIEPIEPRTLTAIIESGPASARLQSFDFRTLGLVSRVNLGGP
jgi:carbamoyl-phosphate synthase large subunit